jgi:monoamine oxidase
MDNMDKPRSKDSCGMTHNHSAHKEATPQIWRSSRRTTPHFVFFVMAAIVCTALLLQAAPGFGHRTYQTVPKYDVAVVGGGLSGLSTAYNIHSQNSKPGRTTVVLEARDRLGGRVLNRQVRNGGVQEMGAEYIGPTQDEVLSLARMLGLRTYPAYDQGNNIFFNNGTDVLYPSNGLPPLAGSGAEQLFNAVQAMDELASSIKVGQPWTHPDAERLDSQTLASWLDDQFPKESGVKDLVTLLTNNIWATENSELSLLYFLSYLAAAGNSSNVGNINRLISTKGGAQELRVEGGTQLLAIRLGSKLEAIGGKRSSIKLNTPIRKIAQKGPNGPYVLYSDGSTPVAIADAVVVAMSPPLAGRIIYDPPLPAARDQLTQRMPMGAIGKAIATYPTPFWRARNLTGQVLSTDASSTARTTFDNSPSHGEYGAIMAFLEADVMRELDGDATEEEIEALIIKDFVKYFGKEAGHPIDFVLQRWDLEEFSRGGPTAFAPPAVLTNYGPALTKSFNGIFWAGTETSDYWQGYMDGALRSGKRAAQQVLARLDG